MESTRTLLDSLSSALQRYLEQLPALPATDRPISRGIMVPEPESPAARARNIAQQMLKEALANGFPVEEFPFESKPVGEGSTADLVTRIRMHLGFIFKVQSERKLVNEAQVIQRIRGDLRLPQTFRDRFPRIYALKHDAPPYAYLMEDFSPEGGFRSVAKELFASNLIEDALETQGRFLMTQVMDAMLEGYENSVDRRKRISIWGEDYVGRICGRLQAAAKLDACFESRPMVVNGQELLPWEAYLSCFESHRDKMESLIPPFCTVVMGDPNPENVLCRYIRNIDGELTADIKFIDPKEWGEGDYAFDLAKLAHYIHATGPIELLPGKMVLWQVNESGSLVVDYTLNRPAWVEKLTSLIRERAQSIAAALNDTSPVDLRFKLAMSANLLGLPVNRWAKKNLHDEAVVLYAEGMIWLDQVCKDMEKNK